MCTYTGQVERQHCSRTGRVQKNHKMFKNTIFNDHPVKNKKGNICKRGLKVIVGVGFQGLTDKGWCSVIEMLQNQEHLKIRKILLFSTGNPVIQCQGRDPVIVDQTTPARGTVQTLYSSR